MRFVPESANRKDWPRLVAQAVNRLIAPEVINFQPTSTPPSPKEGATYFDSTTKKLRTYDGTTWQDHW